MKALSAKLSFIFLVSIALVSFLMPLFPSFDPNSFDPMLIGDPLPPSLAHIFGTDDLVRDILIRIIDGARISLLVGVVSVGISIFIGIFIGVISGYLGGVIDEIIMRILDFFMAIPTLFLILIIQIQLKPSIYNVMIVIGLTSWMGTARLVRAEVLSIKQRVFVLAARSRGISHQKILWVHILPHTLNPIIVSAVLGMGGAILTESVLSFLGLGVQPPHASWGNMLQNSLAYMTDAPWLAIIPGIMITLTVLALNYLGDAFREKLNPDEHTS